MGMKFEFRWNMSPMPLAMDEERAVYRQTREARTMENDVGASNDVMEQPSLALFGSMG
jgi:hypothetical protein